MLACLFDYRNYSTSDMHYWERTMYIIHILFVCIYLDPDKALFMEVTEEQRQLAQQARAYGEQMQALTEAGGGKKKVVVLIASTNTVAFALVCVCLVCCQCQTPCTSR